jgi:hypothetical protein
MVLDGKPVCRAPVEKLMAALDQIIVYPYLALARHDAVSEPYDVVIAIDSYFPSTFGHMISGQDC